MARCACGGKLSRIHRTFQQKLAYMALFRCRQCGEIKTAPRRFMFYFASETLCPLCGTQKLRRLAEPDRIDPLHWNLYGITRWIFRPHLYHCRYCRIQFYDIPRGAARPGGAPVPSAGEES